MVVLRRAALAALSLLLFAPPDARGGEFWVVNEGSRDITIIDTATEVVLQTVPLAGLNEPVDPFGVAFARLGPPHVGLFVFVTQGTFIRVLDVPTRTIVETIDVAALLPPGVTLLRMFHAAAGPPRAYLDDTDQLALRSHLFVAANVSTPGGPEPWYLVFDQAILADIAPPGPSPLVDSGPLAPAGQAIRPEVLHEPFGQEFERVWFTVREATVPEKLRAVRLASGSVLPADFAIAEARTWTLGLGQQVPLSLGVSAPYASPLPIIYAPTGAAAPGLPGQLLNLESGGTCGPFDDARAILVTGPGAGDHTIALVGPTSTLAAEELTVVDASNCSTQSYGVGAQPSDLDVVGELDWEKFFVVCTGSDEVTAVSRDGTSGTMITGSGPVAGDMLVEFEGSCAPSDSLQLSLVDGDGDGDKDDILLEWSTVGCSPGTNFVVECRCLEGSDIADCPSPCILGVEDPGGAESMKVGGDWVPIGPGTGGGNQTHYNAGGVSALAEYNVSPEV